MESFVPFFGQIVGRNDIDFLNKGNRKSIVETHNLLTNNLGGVIEGLDVTPSIDGKTLSINMGTLVTAGVYNEKNNQGGGEYAKLYSQVVATTFPETPPQGTSPTYILISAQISTSNTNPNPLQSQVLTTSKNLQTGENTPTREYPQVNIVFSNPITSSSVSSVSGIPLALFQVNYDGIVKSDSNGKIYNLDTSVKRNYIIGGSVDIATQQILDAGIPDGLITTRMIADGQIAGSKLEDDSIGTVKISSWDGTSAYNELTSSGIANQQLKDEAITEEKLNYKLSLDGFNVRNLLMNSSFEIVSGTTLLPATWYSNYDSTLGTEIRIDTGETVSKFGNAGLFLDGGVSAGSAQSVSVSQEINFGESLLNVPITAFFWAKQTAEPNFATTGTTGLQGKIEFLNSSDGVVQTETFVTLSGVTSINYEQYTSTAPLLYTGTVSCQKIRYTIGGTYDGSYYIDGAFLGKTSIIPNFDINPSEYVSVNGVDASLITGLINGSQIASNTITNNNIASETITTSNIANNSITTTKIGDGSVTAAKLAAGTGLVPAGAIILWDDSVSAGCPTGFTEISDFAGLFPLGRQSTGILNTAGQNSSDLGGANRATTEKIGKTSSENGGYHVHGQGTGGTAQAGTGSSVSGPTSWSTHNHDTLVPFKIVRFCKKD